MVRCNLCKLRSLEKLLTNVFGHIVQLLMSSRGFSLLIWVVIYQNVHLDDWVSKVVVANFFQKFEGQGQK